MWRRNFVGLTAASLLVAGCANLHVTKVTAEKRCTEEDRHVKGFRYYLSRPYVVVKAPVLVCETSVLYVVKDKDAKGEPVPAPKPKEEVSRINPASGVFESVSDAELAVLRRLMEKDPGVKQVVFKDKKPPVEVSQTIIDQGGGVKRLADLADQPGDVVVTGAVVQGADSAATLGDAAAAAASADRLGIPTVTADTAVPERNTADHLRGDVQIVFLPDLDEQYAVHNCNVLSKSAYTLHFKDGWELTDVNGEFDSTAVPLEILNFIDKAITAAKTVALAGVQRQAKLLGADVADRSPPLKETGYTIYQVITTTYLKPGVYRINKPWEMANGGEAGGCGLLAKLGLATFETTRIETPPVLKQVDDVICPAPAR